MNKLFSPEAPKAPSISNVILPISEKYNTEESHYIISAIQALKNAKTYIQEPIKADNFSKTCLRLMLMIPTLIISLLFAIIIPYFTIQSDSKDIQEKKDSTQLYTRIKDTPRPGFKPSPSDQRPQELPTSYNPETPPISLKPLEPICDFKEKHLPLDLKILNELTNTPVNKDPQDSAEYAFTQITRPLPASQGNKHNDNDDSITTSTFSITTSTLLLQGYGPISKESADHFNSLFSNHLEKTS